MKIISSMRAERSIAQFLGERDVDAPAAKKAAESLRKLGRNAIPNVINALSAADQNQTAVLLETLASQVDDKTFPQFAAGLGHSDQRCVTGVAAALAKATGYNANKLIDLLGDDGISKPALIDVLHKKTGRLNVAQLLTHSYTLEPREKGALFKIIAAAATDADVPELLSRIEGKDHSVRTHVINILSGFNRADVAQALIRQLNDPNKAIRQAALVSLGELDGPFEVKQICNLLLDPDLEVQNKAVDLLIKMNDPDTMKYLVSVLKDESEYARRSAVEVLNEIADPKSIRHLLTAIEDEDWWVRSRASDALAAIGGRKVMDAVLQLISDDNENVRRAAIEILNQTKDPESVSYLIKALHDEDWWVSERAADALGEIGDPTATPALLEMLQGDHRSVPAAIRAVARIGGAETANNLLPLLRHEEKAVRLEAIAALGKLADQGMATSIKAQLQPLMSGSDDTIAKMATDAVVSIDARFSTTSVQNDGIAEKMREQANTLLIGEPDMEQLAAAATGLGNLDITKLKSGDVIEGRYRYIEKIGKGAFGTV
ncbi:MAG: HEAT repeat domain-containing protein, partial [Gammaproteobacteria bacterium]|nr:HEAT repeat domain-containing protein [Gammaproteobacteria bacterium]